MRTYAITFERCGWGISGGLVPEIRLGWVRLWKCRGSVISQLASMRVALRKRRLNCGS